jgi:hypothetical protein
MGPEHEDATPQSSDVQTQNGRRMASQRCLVLLPIGVTLRKEGPTFLAIYAHVLRPALLATGFPLVIFRADEVLRSGLTVPDGRLWLQEPHVIVAELTTRHSGVLHDLRLRNSLATRTILLSQQATDIPPDFATYRQILYTLSEAGMAQLYQDLKQHVAAILCPPPLGVYSKALEPLQQRGIG